MPYGPFVRYSTPEAQADRKLTAVAHHDLQAHNGDDVDAHDVDQGERDKSGEAWYHGDTANLSIGQGFLLVTPVQMFRVIAAVANGGSLTDPYLVKEIVDSQGKVVESFSPGRGKKIPISSSVFDFLGKSLRGVVREGTGWRAENKIVKIAGKTGTAESSDEERDHNWFIGYTLSDELQSM